MSPDLHQKKKHLASPSSLSNSEASTHRVIDLHQLIVRLPPTISHSIAQKFSGLKDSLSKINMSTEKIVVGSSKTILSYLSFRKHGPFLHCDILLVNFGGWKHEFRIIPKTSKDLLRFGVFGMFFGGSNAEPQGGV